VKNLFQKSLTLNKSRRIINVSVVREDEMTELAVEQSPDVAMVPSRNFYFRTGTLWDGNFRLNAEAGKLDREEVSLPASRRRRKGGSALSIR
jgi:hypothetical protein